MLHSTKKNQVSYLKSPAKTSIIRSKSTDHLLSSHKSPSKKNILQKNVQSNQFSQIKIMNISKSKSTKSIKSKPNKSTPKNSEQKSKKTNKKKGKSNGSQCKTVKKSKNILKNMHLSQQSFNSFESLKKPETSQYFFYQNNYIPIQNSAQRRFVIKIKQIDQKYQKDICQQSTSQAFFNKTQKLQINNQSVQTDKIKTLQIGLNTFQPKSQQFSAQTQKEPIEDASKCFSQTLTDLQFLFLPDQKNFIDFSKAQRVHYKQMLETIAMKIWNSGNVNLQQLTPQKIQILLYQRQCIQMGLIEYFPEQGFPTHVYSVMSYLSNLVSYAQIQDRDQILAKFQNIFGYNYRQRFSKCIRGQSTTRKSNGILSQQLFLGLEHQLFKDHQFTSQLIEKCVHIHNKAIFDAVNEQLQKYKPFYCSKGQPFPWAINFGMTYFSIDQSSLGFLFRQIKEKILTKFGYLCGILVNYQNYKELPTQKHQIHEAKLKMQETRMIHDQLAEYSDQPQVIESITKLKCQISNEIMQKLLEQLYQDLNKIQNSENHIQNDFVFEF